MIEHVCFDKVLIESAKEVFETMIFMDIQESTDSQQQTQGDLILGSITFSGDLDGCLGIQLTNTCAQAIAKNMLGMEPEENINEEDINDAIGEVANMVMGSVKARLQDDCKKIDVSIPTVVNGQKIKQNLGHEASEISVNINIEDEYVAKLSLFYKENPK